MQVERFTESKKLAWIGLTLTDQYNYDFQNVNLDLAKDFVCGCKEFVPPSQAERGGAAICWVENEVSLQRGHGIPRVARADGRRGKQGKDRRNSSRDAGCLRVAAAAGTCGKITRRRKSKLFSSFFPFLDLAVDASILRKDGRKKRQQFYA